MRIEVNVITGEITEHEDAPVTVEEVVATIVEETVVEAPIETPVEETPAPVEGE